MDSSNLVGQTLSGRYQIDSLIGRGGMAAVYKARDPNLRRTVAIKVIHTHLSNNPDFLRRFEEEAAAIAHLRHPNIVQVFDFNHENGMYYMVMEFIAGETLQIRLKRLREARQRLSIKDTAGIARDICSAAEEAHKRGMIHRDIKPANVMLAVNGNAVLMDFGVARIVSSSYHTVTGAVMGTASYMSPEQIQGYHADARADIYSIGVMLFEMLGGRPPFEADSVMSIMMMHLNDPVPDIRKLQPDTPEEMVKLINKALAKKPEQRFQSANEMALSLNQALNSVEQRTPQPPPVRQYPAAAIPKPIVQATILEAAGRTVMEPVPDSQAAKQAVPIPRPSVQSQPDRTILEPQASPPRSRPPASEIAPPAAPANRKSALPWLLLASILVLAVVGAAGYFSNRSYFDGLTASFRQPPPPAVVILPTATPTPEPIVVVSEPLPSETPTPSEAEVFPMPTLEESPTPTPAPVVIGGADKIAFFNENNVWVSNLDGTNLTQLTVDGATKSYLRWLPDGQGLSYISGKCINTVSLEAVNDIVTCFPNSDFLDSFEVSPDGTQVVISLDHMLYLLPFDLEMLKEADRHSDLVKMGVCPGLAPYERNFAHMVRWSDDGKKWAALVLGVLKDGRRGDVVQVFPVDRCLPNPMVQILFPQPHFSFKEYDRNPSLESIAWDGETLFSFHDNVRNDGFGNLHVFNIETYRPSLNLNPIDNVCCYRDIQWSPDGLYLLFAFQNYLQGADSTSQLYYIPYSSIGSGTKYEPLPLPIFTDPRAKPQPVLRPALTP